MPSLHDTAYPRLTSVVAPRDLALVYTPSWDDVVLANRATRGASARVCFLVLLKTFQRLGYAVPVAEVPPVIVEHVAHAVGITATPVSVTGYDTSGTR